MLTEISSKHKICIESFEGKIINCRGTSEEMLYCKY